MTPFFSIGITTFNRVYFLKECIKTILEQEYKNFEVIIGNDFIYQELTEDILGYKDSRIKIINHKENIGPIANANNLIALSKGNYFTLIADDDLHASKYFQVMHKAILKYKYPKCIFTNFTSDYQEIKRVNKINDDICIEFKEYTGPDFLTSYLSRNLNTVGCYGVFDLSYLRKIGGMRQLGYGRSMYGEMPLVFYAGLQHTVVYSEIPLVYFRVHEGSLSNNTDDVGEYISSQRELIKMVYPILVSKSIKKDFNKNFYLLLKWCINDVLTVMSRSQKNNLINQANYVSFLYEHIFFIKNARYIWKVIIYYIFSEYIFFKHITKSKLRSLINLL